MKQILIGHRNGWKQVVGNDPYGGVFGRRSKWDEKVEVWLENEQVRLRGKWKIPLLQQSRQDKLRINVLKIEVCNFCHICTKKLITTKRDIYLWVQWFVATYMIVQHIYIWAKHLFQNNGILSDSMNKILEIFAVWHLTSWSLSWFTEWWGIALRGEHPLCWRAARRVLPDRGRGKINRYLLYFIFSGIPWFPYPHSTLRF